MAGEGLKLGDPASCPRGPGFHVHLFPAGVAVTCAFLAWLVGPAFGGVAVVALLLGSTVGIGAAIRHCNL